MTRRTAKTPLDKLLNQAGLKNKWLAAQLKVNESQISRWRRGANIPAPGNQRRIAKALGVTVEALWPEDKA
jgi:ribosome-binding protein aMBF1 (putative translation factor)